jgi:hypothetical protein
MTAAVQGVLRDAARRAAARDARGVARGAAFVAALWCAGALLVVFAGPSALAGPARVAAAAAVAAGIAATCAALVRRRDPRASARMLDRELSLPDSALATVEISSGPGSASPAWAQAVAADFLDRHRQAAATIPRRAGISLPALALALLAVAVAVWVPRPHGTNGVPAVDDPWTAPAAASDLAGDWQRYAQEPSGPAAEAVRRALAPLREGIAATSREEALVKIGHAGDILRRAAEDLPVQDPGAPADQAWSDPVLGALAAGDPAEALDVMRGVVSSMPPAEAVERLARTASRLDRAGFSKSAEAVRAMAGAGASSAGAFEALEEALGEEMGARLARGDLDLARLQIEAVREAVGQSSTRGGADPMPELSRKTPGAPGAGAGGDASSRTEGGAAPRDPLSIVLPVAGTTSAKGESTVTSLRTTGGPATKPTRTATDSATLPGMLSADAVPDENLPPAHRATVRKYFETLRSKIQ